MILSLSLHLCHPDHRAVEQGIINLANVLVMALLNSASAEFTEISLFLAPNFFKNLVNSVYIPSMYMVRINYKSKSQQNYFL